MDPAKTLSPHLRAFRQSKAQIVGSTQRGQEPSHSIHTVQLLPGWRVGVRQGSARGWRDGAFWVPHLWDIGH